jgi:hypothetical protein
MFTAFSKALTALQANTVGLDVIGNNLANLNTTGFKASVTQFHELIAESLGGIGGSTEVGLGTGRPKTLSRESQDLSSRRRSEAPVVSMLLPTTRADFALHETYTYAPGPLLVCPISTLGGVEDDHVAPHELEAWRKETHGDFSIRMFPGGHFYLRDHRLDLSHVIAEDLAGTAQDDPRPACQYTPAPPVSHVPLALG